MQNENHKMHAASKMQQQLTHVMTFDYFVVA